ncbi:MAP kinase kinase kinase win1 [Cladobotryum mycophilum]|uniref:non-specific serine/threonine protein kinase n=1 Tax=Cladobotryum mycophilum TaxID=491253 RepID=A0ABR0SY95_9HYPO
MPRLSRKAMRSSGRFHSRNNTSFALAKAMFVTMFVCSFFLVLALIVTVTDPGAWSNSTSCFWIGLPCLFFILSCVALAWEKPQPLTQRLRSPRIAPRPPLINALSELEGIVKVYNPDSREVKYTIFYILSPDDHAFFGQLFKEQGHMTPEECTVALKYIPDERLYPEIPPADVQLTIASAKDEEFILKILLDETFIMEQIAKSPHPNIVHYHGCRIHRGRITGIVLACYELTLTEHLRRGFTLDNEKFATALESAVEHLHGLGLAHNDINPNNIMVNGDNLLVLIDFGSCQPFGKLLLTMATEGWYEEDFFTSEKEHDMFAMRKMWTWLEDSDLNL